MPTAQILLSHKMRHFIWYPVYNRLSSRYRLYNRFDNRLYRVNKHPTGCETGWMFVYTIQPVVKRVWQPCSTQTATVRSTGCETGSYNRFDNRLNVCIHDTTGCETGLTTELTTGCIVYTNIYPVVKPVWPPVVSCKRGLTRYIVHITWIW